MRIAMVSEHASPLATLGGVDAGGQNVYVSSLALALGAQGHQVDVYTRRDAAELPPRVQLGRGVSVVHVPAGPARPIPKDELLQWMPDLGDWLSGAWSEAGGGAEATARPDVVHAHFWMSGLAALRARQALDPGPATSDRLPLVQTFHALGSVKRRFQGPGDTSPAGRIEAEHMLARTVDQIIATCSDEVAELEALPGTEFGFDRSNAARRGQIQVVPCGVDLARFTPVGPRSLPAGLPDTAGSRMRLLCVGRLVERKGVATAIEALRHLPQCHLVVAGGPDRAHLDADEEVARLRALARRAGVEDRVQFTGRVARTDLPALIRWADVVVATPWYEPFGMVTLEAMASGRPVIGSAVGGLLDTVLPGVNGLLVEPRDPAALAAAVHALMEVPLAAAVMRRAARQIAVARYGWDCVAEQILSIYQSLARPAVRPVPQLLTVEAM